MSELTQSRPYAGALVPASVILQKLHDQAPAGHVTLDWLMSSLQKQSFGLITLEIKATVVTRRAASLVPEMDNGAHRERRPAFTCRCVRQARL